MNLSDSKKALLLKLAQQANFYGKRLHDKKLELVETISATQSTLKTLNIASAVEWLESNKPAKAAKKAAAQNKPAADTMQGNETAQRDDVEVLEGERFIITAAQNNTEIASVFPLLVEAANALNATLIVVPVYYNKKAFSASVESDNEYFNQAVRPYLITSDVWLHEEECAKVYASAAIPLTAKQPINAADTLNNGENATLIGHPKVQQKTLLQMTGEDVKTGWTTGSCTKYNYLRGRAGTEAEKYHGFGGVLVDIKDGKPFATNITQAEDGSIMFYDYDQVLHKFGFNKEVTPPCVVLGDSHFEQFDESVFKKCLDLLTMTRPEKVAVHDICHFAQRSHHNIADSSHWYKTKGAQIKDELKFIIDRLNDYARLTGVVYIVESNHNNAVDTWLNSSQTANTITYDTANSKTYHLLKYLVCEAIDDGLSFKGLEVAFSNSELTGLPKLADNVVFGKAHVPDMAYGYNIEQHGHKGANGAAKGLTNGKVSTSLILGHTHSPCISYLTSRGGIITQGTTAKMDQGYNRGGGSSWGQASIIQHCNGMPQQFFHSLDGA